MTSSSASGGCERVKKLGKVATMRFTGMRISDVVTLSRDHVVGTYLIKRAVENKAEQHAKSRAHFGTAQRKHGYLLKIKWLTGGQGRDRTADASLFRAALYR